jgi:cyclic pyranopterin phosphate synthase
MLPDLISGVKTLDRDIHTAVTTNGFLLDRLAPRLAEAGLDSINISGIGRVLAGIRAARRHIRQVKLNCVVMEGVNSEEPPRMIELADRLGVDVRFIEYMPTKHNTSQRRGYVSGDTVRQNLPLNLHLLETEAASAARYYTSDKLKIRVGFIDPVSHPFCDHCDRLRLTADGLLYGCLFSGRAIDLFELLNNDHDTALAETMKLIASKVRAGCLVSNRMADYLPSFVNMGG